MYEVVIIGTGFGGISAAINLNKLGVNNYVMLERRSFYGGTWMQNRYPGAAVDVQSPLYSLENEPYEWDRLFAKRAQLESYTDSLISKHRLQEKIRLNSEVQKAQWLDNYWEIKLSTDEIIQSKSIINATGPLSTPVIPKFKGIEDFQGEYFHSNDWQSDVKLDDKNVAVIGSGASAVQIIPAIKDKVNKLHVFQRTPHWVLPRRDFKFSSWFKPFLKNKLVYGVIKHSIYWLLELRVIAFKYSPLMLKLIGEIPAKSFLKRSVKDKKLRKKLKPDFTIGCKRILVSNDYYPALQSSNVQLHDNSEQIIEFSKHGIKTNKGEMKVDLVVFATGYNAQDSMVSYHVIGKHEVSLATQWQSYPRAYLGTSLPYFPNFFVVTGPNTGIGHTSAIYVIESQIKYIMQCIQLLKTKTSIEPTEYAEDRYTNMVHREMEKTVWHSGGCNSWYQNASGKVIAMFPGFSFVFRRLCKRFKMQDHIIK